MLSSNPDFDVAGEAEDGRDAVRSIRKFKPDLVVFNHATDIRLSTLEKFAKAVGKQSHVALI